MHGGRSSGPKTAQGKAVVSLNGVKHGVYLRGFTKEDLADLEEFHSQAETPTLLEELNVARIQLKRAWVAAGESVGADDPSAGLELIEQRAGSFEHRDVASRKTEVVRRRPDMWIIVDRCLRTYIRAVEAFYRSIEMRDMKDRVAALEGRLPATSTSWMDASP